MLKDELSDVCEKTMVQDLGNSILYSNVLYGNTICVNECIIKAVN